jgi:transcriptional regulator with XRE-family HTH domain
MKTTRELLGARIKELRKRRGLTQEQLAEQVDLATNYISLIEVGKTSPSLETMENVARALGVELKDMFDFMHLEPEEISIGGLGKYFGRVDDRDKRLLMRIARCMGE